MAQDFPHLWEVVKMADGRRAKRCSRCLQAYEFGHDTPCQIIERLAKAEDELRMIDEALARRPALADAPNRYTAICRACEEAGRAERADKAADSIANRNVNLRLENMRMKAALIKLRDCDWVMTPADRMDAVRDIARAALGEQPC